MAKGMSSLTNCRKKVRKKEFEKDRMRQAPIKKEYRIQNIEYKIQPNINAKFHARVASTQAIKIGKGLQRRPNAIINLCTPCLKPLPDAATKANCFVYHQSTAHPFSARNSAHASFSARFGLKSSSLSGSLVKGSVGLRLRCSIIDDRSQDCPFLVC